jgi:hypothetical protein
VSVNSEEPCSTVFGIDTIILALEEVALDLTLEPINPPEVNSFGKPFGVIYMVFVKLSV